MDVSSISSAFEMQKNLAATNASSTNAVDFKEILEGAISSGDGKLKEACDQLEAYMLSMVFKQVKESMLSDDEDSLIPQGDYLKMFESTMLDTLAEKATEAGGIGISNALYNQMKKTYAAQMQESTNSDEQQEKIIDSEI